MQEELLNDLITGRKTTSHRSRAATYSARRASDLLPELIWNQVFSLVDDLSRHALIGLHRLGADYELRALS
jgi:uncharacterized protein involved in propanediol utilization